MFHLRAAGTITMFTTNWCGYCSRLKSQLDKAG
ncbi:glutaredoxin domain-containing protein, partial [Cryobacterium sp. RTS3]